MLPGASTRRLIVAAFSEFVTPRNVDEFLDGVDLVIDSVDFFSFEARRMIFRERKHAAFGWFLQGPSDLARPG